MVQNGTFVFCPRNDYFNIISCSWNYWLARYVIESDISVLDTVIIDSFPGGDYILFTYMLVDDENIPSSLDKIEPTLIKWSVP
jgi:hypothetical protein